MLNSIRRIVLTCLLAGLVAACGSSGSVTYVKGTPGDTSTNLLNLKLAPGDKVRVTVFGEDKISGDYDIDTAGYISLPLAGSVMAAGLSKPELERELARRLAGDYLKSPKVTVSVVTFRPFFILGEVERPGEYQFRSGMNVLSALAMAGGPTFRASRSSVLIQRAGTTELREYPLDATVGILPGDLVRIPERYF
jgi:protein involved in polysaccharide export with SLBB domain